MSRPARPWFRFYVEAFNDRKLLRLTPGQRWMWVAVLGAARESPTPGTLLITEGEPMTRAELARYADVKERDLDRALELMEQFAMIDQGEPITVLNWSERQYESDKTTERTRKHRSKEQPKKQREPVPTGVPRNTPETETETETEKPLAPKARARDPIFDALCELTGTDTTQLTTMGRGALNRAVKELRQLDATGPEIHTRAHTFARKYPNATMTAPALVKHWATLGNGQTSSAPVSSLEDSQAAFSELMEDS